MAEVEKTKGVEAATPFIVTQGMLRSKSGAAGAVIRGIDPSTAGRVMKTLEQLSLPDSSAEKLPGNLHPRHPALCSAKNWPATWGLLRAT